MEGTQYKLEFSQEKILILLQYQKDFLEIYQNTSEPSKETLEKLVKDLIDKHKTNFKGVGQPLRIALTGSRYGPGLYDIILSLDKNEILKRLKMIK